MGWTVTACDEATFQLIPRIKHVWAPKGSKPIAPVITSLEEANFFGALTFDNLIVRSYKKKNRFSFLKFIKYLNKRIQRMVLVMDNVSYHHAKIVARYVEENPDKIKLEFIPAYSPELNPAETPWKLIRNNVTDNNLYPSISELKNGVRNYVRRNDWNINLYNYLCR